MGGSKKMRSPLRACDECKRKVDGLDGGMEEWRNGKKGITTKEREERERERKQVKMICKYHVRYDGGSRTGQCRTMQDKRKEKKGIRAKGQR